ncbi:Protein T10B5.4 [Aphelenchoides avenae]|nr:Protein T10B5.4 [Aphelenchus avenae]
MSDNGPTQDQHSESGAGDDFGFRIADPEKDKEIVFEYMQKHFRVQEPITQAIESSEDDTYAFYQDICAGGFSGPYSLLAFHKPSGRLAGIALNKIKEYTHAGPQARRKSALAAAKVDYAEEIASGPYHTLNGNRLIVFIDEVERNLQQFLPEESAKVFKLDILGVHPDFAGRGLGKRLVEKSLALASETECHYAAGCATAKASQHILTTFGFTCAREVPFASFLEDGMPVYQNLPDGGTSAKLMILKL